jgi:ADP-ribose pyrophosphatase YjhB (NUDIX family)
MRFEHYINEEKLGMKAGMVPFHIDDNGKLKILLIIPSDPAYGGSSYQIAKGRQDNNEKPIETAKREAKEEMGLKKISDIFQVSKTVLKGMMRSYNFFLFACQINDPNDLSKMDFEISHRDWLDTDNLKNIRNSQKDLIYKAIKVIKRKKGIK